MSKEKKFICLKKDRKDRKVSAGRIDDYAEHLLGELDYDQINRILCHTVVGISWEKLRKEFGSLSLIINYSVIWKGVNKNVKDVSLIEIRPKPEFKHILDFIPFCVILYAGRVDGLVQILVPEKYNTVFQGRSPYFLPYHRADLYGDILYELGYKDTILNKIYEDETALEVFGERIEDDDLVFLYERYYKEITGQEIPEIKYDKAQLIKALDRLIV